MELWVIQRGVFSLLSIFLLLISTTLTSVKADDNGAADSDDEDLLSLCDNWTEDSANPIIRPVFPEWMIADPTFLTPNSSPDHNFHLFAHSLTGVHHFRSGDGRTFEHLDHQLLFGAIRPYIIADNSRYLLTYEQFVSPRSSELRIVSSTDLVDWSEPVTILKPELSFEKGLQNTTGNPFLMKIGRVFTLTYSAASIFLPDCWYFEPKYIGMAVANDPFGPYRKNGTPILAPIDGDPLYHWGRGSLKILPRKIAGRIVGFHNSIFKDQKGRSRSAITILTSSNFGDWRPLCSKPIIEPDRGWKRAFVYAFDVREYDGKLWLYFNARNGWLIGREQIGLATHPAP